MYLCMHEDWWYGEMRRMKAGSERNGKRVYILVHGWHG